MSGALFGKELAVLIRNRSAVALAAMLIVLVAAAAALGVQRTDRIALERAAAAQTDRAVWDGQGERNPHSAAHFSRYAFKPLASLSAFDPGVADYAGLAVWMEAHYQNPAVFRRAEDLGESLRLGALSPAWILQVVAPLLIFVALYSSIAGEREDGTLRQVSATGAPAGAIVGGKLSGALSGVGAVLIPAVALAAFAAAPTDNAALLADGELRLAGLVAAYLGYFVGVALVAIGVSALFRQRRNAFLALMALWAFGAILVPRLGADLALALYPEPSAESLLKELSEASDAYWDDEQYQKTEEQRILAQYGVEKVEDLPISYAAFQLQSGEEHAHRLFEALYGKLRRLHGKHDEILSFASLLSPTLAVSQLSSGLAATDRLHHDAFVAAAEAHRRKIIKQLNEDMQNNAGPADYGYKTDEKLWRAIEDFAHAPPAFFSVYSAYTRSAAVLLAYLVVGLLFARWAVSRAISGSLQA